MANAIRRLRPSVAIRRLRPSVGLTAALVAAPFVAVALAPVAAATGDCLAWFGSRGDGICLGYSNGSSSYIGTPDVGIYGPNGVNSGIGLVTGPLLPGQTINVPISP